MLDLEALDLEDARAHARLGALVARQLRREPELVRERAGLVELRVRRALRPPAAGLHGPPYRARVGGHPVGAYDRVELRRTVGVVFEDTFLFSGNVAENLRLNAEISDQELAGICRDLGLNALLQRLPNGLETELRERGGNLSSGERQLLAVARVAIRNPTVLVMDEATAFMDPSTEATLQRDLDRLLQKRTAVVIAHRLATVEASDRILVLRSGELIEQGTHLELRARGGLYAQLAELQEKGLARL